MTGSSLEPDYFDRLYAANPDPWRFETSDYEQAKYAATVNALSREHYASGVEIGCSIGILTALIAPRCGRLLGLDVADGALVQARRRCKGHPNIDFALMRLPTEYPSGRYDLILISEVLYYFDRAMIADMAEVVASMASPGAEVILVHWLGPTPDYPLNGDSAVLAFLDALGPRASLNFQDRRPEYRLDRLRFE